MTRNECRSTQKDDDACHRKFSGQALFVVITVISSCAWAQPAIDSGAVLRGIQQQPVGVPELPQPKEQGVSSVSPGTKMLVVAFEVVGSTKFTDEAWQKLLADFVGQELGIAELQAAADRISLHYRKAGLHAIAILPEQDLGGGRVLIRVIEGRLGSLRLLTPEHSNRVPLRLIEQIVGEGQSPGDIVDVNALERATLIASDVPGLKVTTVLQAGKNAGETDIEAKIESAPLVAANLSVDNFDSRVTGRHKFVGNLIFNNPMGLGDQFIFSAQQSAGKKYGSASINMPLLANGLRGGLNVSQLSYRLQDEFASLGGRGDANTWGVTLSYPLVRSQITNFIVQLQHTESHQINDSDLGNVSDKRARSTAVNLTFNHLDSVAGGGITMAGIGLIRGRVDLSGNAADLSQDQLGPKRNGNFSKLTFNLARLQRITAASQLWISLNGQVSGKNLDSGDEFSLGGATGVRAYPALEASGDSGSVMTFEYRHALPRHLRASVFYDHGWVRINHDNRFSGAAARNVYALNGAGIGIDWTPQTNLTVRSSLAWRLRENPAPVNGRDNDGTKRTPQIWLQAQYDF